MVGNKEVVLFTQEKNYCIKHRNSLDQLENKKKLRLYGVVTGLSVISQRFARNTPEVEIRNHFARTIDFNEFIVLTKDLKDSKIGFAVNKDIAFSIFQEYNLVYMTIADIVLINAYWDYVSRDKRTIIGYLDTLNGFLVYMMVGDGNVHQFLQRKSIKPDMFGSSSTEDKIKELAEEELKNIINLESKRINGENIEYAIAGLNDDFERIFHATINIQKKESLHRFFVNERTVLYKKAVVAMLFLGAVFDATLVPQYFSLQRKLGIANKRLSSVQRYIDMENKAIKRLYVEKGKTIVLQDKIDLSKLSKILNHINILPPGKVVYKSSKGNEIVDLYYVNRNILAQKYYQILKKNRNIGVQLLINPTMSIADIHVVIPKSVLR